MPFDPSLPVNNVQVLAAVLRGQFNGLFDLIQAVPAGPQGIQGPPGNDGAAGLNGNNGADGQNGTNGTDGQNGTSGIDGMPGPPGPSVAGSVVDAVNTLDPGNSATVQTTFDGSNVHFTFGIPRGQDGPTGSTGSNGNDGQNGADGINGNDGPQGPPGEVSNSDLSNAINGTSANTNAVATLGITVSDPPTQGELQSIANKLDELINTLRR